jgi:serine/threonine protein phosphatase PrpC
MGNLLGAPVLEKETHEGSTTNGEPYGVSSMQGWRVHMEDAHITETSLYASEKLGAGSYQSIPLPEHSLFAVFDGHGGTFAAVYAGNNFCRVLSRQPHFVAYAKWRLEKSEPAPSRNGLDLLEAALVHAFVDIDKEIACSLKGTTVTNADDPYHAEHATTTNTAGTGSTNDPMNVNYNSNSTAATSATVVMEDDNTSPADSALKLLEQEGDSGTTACVVLLTPDYVICANAGDSRAVMSTSAGMSRLGNKALAMSFDHKPDDEDEERRIREAGGYVAGGRVEGDLAVSRGLGDFRFKNMDVVMAATDAFSDLKETSEGRAMPTMKPGEQKVSPIPDIVVQNRNPQQDEFLVIACDGIWDVLSNQDCVQMISTIFDEGERSLGLACEEVKLSFVRFLL